MPIIIKMMKSQIELNLKLFLSFFILIENIDKGYGLKML